MNRFGSPSALDWNRVHLAAVPANAAVMVLLRHSARDEIPAGSAGLEVPLNEFGAALCRELGPSLAGRLRSVRSSPVLRCVQTAELLLEAAGEELEVRTDQLLGAPGAYVLDEKRAWQNWVAHGNDGVIQRLIDCDQPMPGMAHPVEAAQRLVSHMFEVSGLEPGLHLFISHDALVAPTAAKAMGCALASDMWPRYLEGAFFWKGSDGVSAAYRDRQSVCWR